MSVATLGSVRAQTGARRIETGAMLLDPRQYAEFRKTAQPTEMERIAPGDVVLVAEMGDIALVRTVRRRARVGKSISLDGMVRGSSIEILAIARANFGEQA